MKIELNAAELKLVLDGLIHAAMSHRESMQMFQPFEDDDSRLRFEDHKAKRDDCFNLHATISNALQLGEFDA